MRSFKTFDNIGRAEDEGERGCAERALCEASAECVADAQGTTSIFCQLGSYVHSSLSKDSRVLRANDRRDDERFPFVAGTRRATCCRDRAAWAWRRSTRQVDAVAPEEIADPSSSTATAYEKVNAPRNANTLDPLRLDRWSKDRVDGR